jgi:hypothetical protein
VRRMAIVALGFVVLLVASGCAGGVASYHRIDMGRDLDAASLARYQAETQQVSAGGRTPHMAVLEHTNWWPLGILAYWRQGTVQVMHDADGQPVYMVSQSTGYGPLSLLWVDGTDAMFAADGTRLNTMEMSAILGCHLVMFHKMGNRSPQGQWWEHSSTHLFCHLINFGTMHGETNWSLITSPGPVGGGR